MANQSDGQWPIPEPDEYQYSDFAQPSLLSDSASFSFDQFDAAHPDDEFSTYPPLYTDDSTSLVSGPFDPSLSRGGDPTPASSYHAPTYPSSEPPSSFEAPPFLDRHVADESPPPAPPQPAVPSAGSYEHLRTHELNFQFLGGNPAIYVDASASASWHPTHLQDYDLPMPLAPAPAPAAAEYTLPLLGVPQDVPHGGGGFSQTHHARSTRGLAVPRPAVGRPSSDPGVHSSSSFRSSSQLMVRGHSMRSRRSGKMSEKKRAEVAQVRDRKACTHCRIRKVRCDLEDPCHRHLDIPELCDREKLTDVLLRGNGHGPWLLERDADTMVNGLSRQPCYYYGGGTVYAPVASASFLDGGGQLLPTDHSLDLQPHDVGHASPWAHPGYGYGYGQSSQGYYASLPSALPFGTVPMSTSGNWPGAGAGTGSEDTNWALAQTQQQHPSPSLWQQVLTSSPSAPHHQHAASHLPPSRPTVSHLRAQLEEQITREMAAPGPVTFETAVQTLVFVLRDEPHMWLSALPAPSYPSFSASSSTLPQPTPRRTNNKSRQNHKRAPTASGGGGGGGASADAPLSARYLLRNACDMTCWVRLWRAPGGLALLRPRRAGSGGSGVGGRGGGGGGGGGTERRGEDGEDVDDEEEEGEQEAWEALARAERLVLEELDGLLGSGIRGIEVPVLACLWQMILLYREAIVAYEEDLRGGYGAGGGGMRFEGGPEHVSRALITAEHLSRLLVARYAAFFGGTSSIIFPKAGDPSTSHLLAGHRRIQMAWDNFMALRTEFYSEIVASSRRSDVLLRTVVVDHDVDMDRRRTIK